MFKRATAVALLSLAAVACSGGSSSDVLPRCSTGQGSNGDRSVLRISQNGDQFTGTYDVTPAGEAGNTALRFQVSGSAHDGRLESEWAVGPVVVTVTGRYTDQEITLDNPTGEFSTTRFTAGC